MRHDTVFMSIRHLLSLVVRRRNSEWGDNLGGWNSARSNVTWPERNCINLQSTRSVDLRWVNMRAYNFLIVDQSSSCFFSPNVAGVVVDYAIACLFFDMSIRSGDIRDQSLKLSERILDFFCLPNFRGAGPPKVVPKLSCLPRGTSCGKVPWGYSPEPPKL